jgi:hypothetical protein
VVFGSFCTIDLAFSCNPRHQLNRLWLRSIDIARVLPIDGFPQLLARKHVRLGKAFAPMGSSCNFEFTLINLLRRMAAGPPTRRAPF